MHIEIVTTPNEMLKESGFGSLTSCSRVRSSLQKGGRGHSVRLTTCSTKSDLDDIVSRSPELVILAVKYISLKHEDDIWLSDYFTQHNINYTGSPRDVLNFDSNKVLAKTHLANKGIKTAKYFIAIPGQYKTETELPISFPLFLKPSDAANGNGIDDLSFVTSFIEYESKLASLYKFFKQPVLIEEYLDGREYTVAVIKTHDEQLFVSAVEVIPPASTKGLRILGSQVKTDDSEKLVKIKNSDIANKVTRLAIDAFNNMGVRDFGRIDIKTDKSGECFFMEANLVPGMTHGSSYFPEACNIANEFTYDQVIGLMLDGVLTRSALNMLPTMPFVLTKSFTSALSTEN